MEVRKAEIRYGPNRLRPKPLMKAREAVNTATAVEEKRINDEIAAIKAEDAKYKWTLTTAEGVDKTMPLSEVVPSTRRTSSVWAARSVCIRPAGGSS